MEKKRSKAVFLYVAMHGGVANKSAKQKEFLAWISIGSEMPQRHSTRASHPLRTSNSDSDPVHHRPITDRSPKLGDRCSPRGAQPDSLNQKKLGTRIADLESQLGQAQVELKTLKEQLASAEAAKKEAQKELEKKAKKGSVPVPEEDSKKVDEVFEDNQLETDVFEVQVETETVEPKVDPPVDLLDQTEKENNPTEILAETQLIPEPEKLSFHDLALKDDEINMLKNTLEEKQNELGVFGMENENLKNQLNEANLYISTAKSKEEEMSLKLGQLGVELEASKANAAQLKEKLEAAEGANEALETEMKKMKVQTEQWRKAADAAAAVLAGGVELNGRIPERCGSMDKHFGGIFEPQAGGYAGFVGSPGMADDLDDGFGRGKRKSSGIKKFGDLWKKKGQK
ncbi:hypothetical protein SADUNF_Sadunf16G0248000 [Salix dunnii]|uniref:Interactor of constitutive active rops 1 n=1 Tax=Salix dunnii TaxID=1413687 RepID=A0A835MR63_9ROSI|nr:hypothetical protein SADUNF_Sadunf16G0248000 [Salix dunnii]